MVKNRLKYSILLILANIVVFAHAFIPHHDLGHDHSLSISTIEKVCQCSECSSETNTTNKDSESPCCGCCDDKVCYLSGGYISSNNSVDIEFLPLISFDFILSNFADILLCAITTESKVNTPYVFVISESPYIQGIGMRAPPVSLV